MSSGADEMDGPTTLVHVHHFMESEVPCIDTEESDSELALRKCAGYCRENQALYAEISREPGSVTYTCCCLYK